jgi:hypothetical protein
MREQTLPKRVVTGLNQLGFALAEGARAVLVCLIQHSRRPGASCAFAWRRTLACRDLATCGSTSR